jgi:hypothetical protein
MAMTDPHVIVAAFASLANPKMATVATADTASFLGFIVFCPFKARLFSGPRGVFLWFWFCGPLGTRVH